MCAVSWETTVRISALGRFSAGGTVPLSDSRQIRTAYILGKTCEVTSVVIRKSCIQRSCSRRSRRLARSNLVALTWAVRANARTASMNRVGLKYHGVYLRQKTIALLSMPTFTGLTQYSTFVPRSCSCASFEVTGVARTRTKPHVAPHDSHRTIPVELGRETSGGYYSRAVVDTRNEPRAEAPHGAGLLAQTMQEK